jgi:protoporphyrinogen oxidase
MNVAIIGGGFTGLTAAYELTKRGHTVTIYERDSTLGGLAIGWKEKNWDWSLEKAYHHMFTNDAAILALAKELGIENRLIIKRPITANYYEGRAQQFDGAIPLLKFQGLALVDKIRTGIVVVFCKLWPFWQTLEGVSAKDFFSTWGGSEGWRVIWEPLMKGKFGDLSDTIAASWLWARITKRTPSLVYIEGGFQTLVDELARAIVRQGGIIKLNTEVQSIDPQFDRVLLTIPTPIAQKLIPELKTTPIPHLHAQVMVLETTKPILNSTYWLSITDRTFPFLAVVAHTNFMDRKHYGGNHLTYVGNYLPDGHKYLKMNKEQLLKEFMPYIKRLCPTMNQKLITNNYLYTVPFAQPVHQINYSKRAPKLITPVPHVFLANMDSIYPWDRGTNYAVELGQKAAAAIIET